MRRWYFGTGGMFLSQRTRVSYFALKLEIQRALEAAREDGASSLEGKAPGLIASAGELRAHMARDLGTRRSPPKGIVDA